MAVNNEVNIQLKATDEASAKFKELEKNASGFWGKLASLWWPLKAVGIGVAAIWASAVVMGKQFLDSANESVRVSAQLDQVIKSTGGAAWLTAEEVKKMASELQNVTTIGDDAIIAGQNMLLTFTGIGKEVFPQVTQTMLDMATALNNGVTPSAEQLSGQAIMLWKALNDPAEGMTALTRVGVVFTEQQKEQIKTLTESGDVIGAQKVILDELAKEYGGQATAQAKTFEGQQAQLMNTIGDVGETIWMALIPALTTLMERIKPMILTVAEATTKWFENEENVQKVTNTMLALINVVKATAEVVWFIIKSIFSFWESLGMATANVVIFTTAVWDYFVWLWNKISETWDNVKASTLFVWDYVKNTIINKIKEALDYVTSAFEKIQALWNKIIGVVNKIKSTASSVWAKVGDFVSGTKANGWPVMAWQSYIVWERGAERFVPATNGYIVPNGGWSSAITINMGGVSVNNKDDADYLANKVIEKITRQLQLNKIGIS